MNGKVTKTMCVLKSRSEPRAPEWVCRHLTHSSHPSSPHTDTEHCHASRSMILVVVDLVSFRSLQVFGRVFLRLVVKSAATNQSHAQWVWIRLPVGRNANVLDFPGNTVSSCLPQIYECKHGYLGKVSSQLMIVKV